jgi:hypothetical protein
MKEIWKNIEGFEGRYEVSNYGRVRSMPRTIQKLNRWGNKSEFQHTGKIMSPKVDKDGYLHIGLYRGNTIKHYRVHRLVAEAFIPNPNNKPQVNHKDENPANNHVSNLDWCTILENARYGTGNQRRGISNGKPVDCFQLDGTYVCQFVSTAEAARQLGLNQSDITRVCTGARGRKQTGGYKFEYT